MVSFPTVVRHQANEPGVSTHLQKYGISVCKLYIQSPFSCKFVSLTSSTTVQSASRIVHETRRRLLQFHEVSIRDSEQLYVTDAWQIATRLPKQGRGQKLVRVKTGIAKLYYNQRRFLGPPHTGAFFIRRVATVRRIFPLGVRPTFPQNV